MKAKSRIFFSLIIAIFLIGLASAEILDSTTQRECIGNSCTLSLYSSPQFVQDNGKWVNIQDAKSLMGKGFDVIVTYGKDATDPQSLSITDFNFTSISIKGIDTSQLSKTSSPLVIKEYSPDGTAVLSKEQSISIKPSDVSKDLTLNWNFGDEIHLGSSSTIISLGGGNVTAYNVKRTATTTSFPISGNNFGNVSRMYLSFNLSAIPQGAVVNSANISLRESGDSAFSPINVTTFWVNYSADVVRTNNTWNTQVCGTTLDALNSNCSLQLSQTTIRDALGKFFGFDVSNAFQYLTALDNASFIIKPDNETIGIWNNTFGFNTQTLIVNYNYSDTNFPSISVYSPTATTYTDSSVLINFTASDNVAIDSQWFSDGTTNTSYTNPVTINLTNGNYVYTFYANDTSNNVNSTSVSFTIDTPTAEEQNKKAICNNAFGGFGKLVYQLISFFALIFIAIAIGLLGGVNNIVKGEMPDFSNLPDIFSTKAFFIALGGIVIMLFVVLLIASALFSC